MIESRNNSITEYAVFKSKLLDSYARLAHMALGGVRSPAVRDS